MTWRPPRELPSRLTIVCWALPVVLGDLLTWVSFVFGCGLAENSDPPYCVGGSPALWLHLPLAGAFAAFVAAALTRELRSYRVLAAGLGCGLVVGVLPWVLYGDPSGNFGGLLA